MATMIKQGLSEKEIEFCKYFEKNLYNKTTATFDKIKTAGDIIGYKADTNCASCARNAWLELLNRYNALLSSWESFKFGPSNIPTEAIKPLQEEICTKYEESLVEDNSEKINKKIKQCLEN